MKAIILAAGKGKRLFPFTKEKPKPLISIVNQPILAHILDNLIGISDEVILIVNYKQEKIKEYFGTTYKGIKLHYITQKQPLGTGHALLQAKDLVTERFLTINGDDLHARENIVAALKKKQAIVAQKHKNPQAFGVIKEEDGFLVDIIEKPKEYISSLINTGLYVLTPKIFPILEKTPLSARKEYELTDAIITLAKEEKVHVVRAPNFWVPVGYPWHMLEATKHLLGVQQENVILGEGSVIEEGCEVKGFAVIGKNTTVKKGTTLHNVIIGDDCVLGEECVVEDSVVADRVAILNHIHLKSTAQEQGTIKFKVADKIYDSGKEKLGVFIGSDCKIEESLKPGQWMSRKE